MINPQRLLDQFITLVQIDSETGQERAICDYLLQRCEQLGLIAHEDDSMVRTGHAAGNIIARSRTEGTPVLFSCHMDTVKPGVGVQPRVGKDYVTSDGTTVLGADDKAGLAALLEGLQVWQEKGRTLPPLEIVLTVGEEAGLVGMRNIDSSCLRSPYGFVLDCDGDVGSIVVSAPAQAVLQTTIYGRSAHAGLMPEKGISAIRIASRAISHMRLGRIDAETTANIGRFQGGVASNIIPDHVEILAEARSCNEAKLNTQVDHMERIFVRTAATYGGEVAITVERPYASFNRTREEPVVLHATRAVRCIGRTPKYVRSGGASDANVLTSYRIPTVNLGIGYEDVHTTKERISLRELNKAAELVVALWETCEHYQE
ncbi:M20/M25/M40 family metallo-hydrolase [Pasteuria penetrans]|uniref:M20/M25/M40 family metallo-hydrolase n=1 Tax=Pasteuria penetrans TaxID=86005 RepID=UPI000FAFA1EE|nr:M20/M25/M40 family metallo-hydrolase [Pasteuria penetrans]